MRKRKDKATTDTELCPWCAGVVTTPESMTAKLAGTKPKRFGLAFLLASFIAGISSIAPLAAVYLGSAALILAICVVAHEAGHLLAAVRGKVVVTEFAFGFGMPLVARTIRGVVVTWRLLPLGGYCQIVGMDGDAQICDEHRKEMGDRKLFVEASTARRLWISLAGVTANLVIAWIALMVAMARMMDKDSSLTQILLIPVLAAEATIRGVGIILYSMGDGIRRIFTGQGGDGLGSVISLPTQMATSAGEIEVGLGIYMALFLGIVSLSLAVLNALPLFPLDGSHVVSTLADAFRNLRATSRGQEKPQPLRGSQLTLYRVATSLPVGALMVFLIVRDIYRVIT